MAASVVDLPEPVVPVTSTIPRGSSAISRTASGSPSSAIVVTPYGMRRHTIEIEPRWRKALTRKRAMPGTAYAKSASPSASISWTRVGSRSISRSACAVSSGVSGSAIGSGVNSPEMRIIGGEPALMCRSDPS